MVLTENCDAPYTAAMALEEAVERAVGTDRPFALACVPDYGYRSWPKEALIERHNALATALDEIEALHDRLMTDPRFLGQVEEAEGVMGRVNSRILIEMHTLSLAITPSLAVLVADERSNGPIEAVRAENL